MKKFLILIYLLLNSSLSIAGGATSGGGDLLGIDAARIAYHVVDSITKIGNILYSSEQLKMLQTIKLELKIVMVDSELPVAIKDVIQNGTAYSTRENNQSTIFLKRFSWDRIPTILEREVIIHHELMILAGIEQSGDYSYSLSFEKHRQNFWKLTENKNFFCSISAFEKDLVGSTVIPGRLIGTSSSVMTSTGARSDWGILGRLENDHALIWRGIIDSSGFFKMEIDEAQYRKGKNLPKELTIDFGTIKEQEPLQVYYDPYLIEQPLANRLLIGIKYVLAVNCNQF